MGIGNPGRQYERTRHNVGFWVVDRLCERAGVELRKKGFEARYAYVSSGPGGEPACFAEPQTYVNLTGEAVRGLADFYKVAPEGVLVVCDDLNLPVGKLRIRRDGSSGGHKGLDSVIRALGTNAFPRLRIGIGQAPPFMDSADYVLAPPAKEEREALDEAVKRAVEAVEMWLADGVERAMARYNAKDAKDAKDAKTDTEAKE